MYVWKFSLDKKFAKSIYLCIAEKCSKDHHILCAINYHIVANFWGRKSSWISQFYSHPLKFSPRNFRHATPIYAVSLTFHESFLREMFPFLYRSMKVFPLYGTQDKNIVIKFSPMRVGGKFFLLEKISTYTALINCLLIVIAAILAQGGVWNGCRIFKGNPVSFTSDYVSFDLYFKLPIALCMYMYVHVLPTNRVYVTFQDGRMNAVCGSLQLWIIFHKLNDNTAIYFAVVNLLCSLLHTSVKS